MQFGMHSVNKNWTEMYLLTLNFKFDNDVCLLHTKKKISQHLYEKTRMHCSMLMIK